MSDIISLYFPHVIKVKAKRYKVSQYGSVQAECKKFTLNIQNTSFNALRIFLGRTFNISGEFTVSFRNQNRDFLPLTSDWDLDVALSESSNTYLYIIIKPQSTEYVLDEWDIIGPADIPQSEDSKTCRNKNSLMGSILGQEPESRQKGIQLMEKTMVKVTRAFSMESSPEGDCDKMPMGQIEFENFFDSDGRMIKPHEFHLSVYQGGVDPQLRPDAWMHLLNVFPEGLTTPERNSYLKSKCHEYYRLKKAWQKCVNEGASTDLLKNAMNLIRKDVRRTDRTEKFYAGADDNKNIQVLFNVLTTYAATHPKLSYCQGMSDLLSPILYVMRDEAYAYICFCGLMKRLGSNFRCDGRSIKMKFSHLRKMLFYYDRELFNYLRNQDASDLLFTYRWLLLELKREFAYTDALHMLEVLWGSLPPKSPEKELDLYDVKFPSSENPMTTGNFDKCLRANSLVWIDNYYALTPSGKKLPQIENARGKNGFEMQTFFRGENSTEEAEIKLPIHYRQRKYRPYIARKLTTLSDSFSSKDTGIVSSRTHDSNQFDICQSWACGEGFESHPLKINAAVLTAREFLRTQWCYSNTVNELQLNNWLNGKRWSNFDQRKDSIIPSSIRQRHASSSDSNYSTNSEELLCESEYCRNRAQTKSSGRSEGYESDTNASLKDDSEEDYDTDTEIEDEDEWFYGEYVDSMFGKKYEEAISYFNRKKELLPPPHVLGDGNPFLLFLCLAMIFQQREKIFCKNMDINELCLFFDKMVRKHKLGQVLSKARCMFGEYLNMGWNEDIIDSEEDFETSHRNEGS